MITESMVTAIEDARCAAMMAPDVAWMGDALADGLLWIHASGSTDTKESFIRGFATGTMLCYRIDRSDVVIRMFGSTAVVSGAVDMDAMNNSVRKSVQSRYHAVWMELDGRLQLVSWQSARR